MNIKELIAELEGVRDRNVEPEVPEYDPGTLTVRIEDESGTFESEILSVEQSGDVSLIVKEPSYDWEVVRAQERAEIVAFVRSTEPTCPWNGRGCGHSACEMALRIEENGAKA